MDFDPLDMPACSRTNALSVFGKLDDEIDRLKIDSATRLKLVELATEADLPLADFIRLVLRCRAWGVDHVAHLHADRVRQVGGLDGGRVGTATTPRADGSAPKPRQLAAA